MKDLIKSKSMIMFAVMIIGLTFVNGISERVTQKNAVADTTTINKLQK